LKRRREISVEQQFGELAQTLYIESTAIEKIEFQSLAMTRSLLSELLELSPAERIQLAQDLWESIKPEEMPPLTAEQTPEMERRYAEHVRNPETASTWDDVKARLWRVIGE